MALLEINKVRKEYRKGDKTVTALNSVDLAIEKGEFLSIVGPSGSGKSTLLNIIGCLDTASSGSVLYNGRELGGLTERQLSDYRRDNIAFIFQSYNLIPVLTVQENVELPLVIERRFSKKQMAEKALAMLTAVGLDGMADRLPRELSGGRSSAWPLPGRSSRIRWWCSPTNRRQTSIQKPPKTSSRSCSG